LISLDVSSSSALYDLHCENNQLTTLDVSDQPDLGVLYCSNNQLTNLDVSNQPYLRELSCGRNQLTTLDISNNSNLGLEIGSWVSCFLEIGDMPSLEQVCVWTEPFPLDNFLLCAESSPNVYYTSECSTGL
jgi:Leucine-rich repeat (LRR) protein